MHLLDWLILAVLAVGVFFAVRYLLKSKNKGCVGCRNCPLSKTKPKRK
jgi:hypothetical protein